MFKDYDVKIFAKTYDNKVIEQIETMLGTGIFDNKKLRIMSDVHVGVGCVIGFTGEIED
jgi:tRNA-splicing ligase RtcB